MIEGMFNRPPEDDAIPVLTEIIAPETVPAAAPEPAADLQAIADEARCEYRADPMSIDFAAELIPMPADAPALSTEMPFPPAAIAHRTELPPASTVPYVGPTPDPRLLPLSDSAAQPSDEVPILTAPMAAGLSSHATPATQTQRLALLPDMDLIALEERLRDSVLARLHPRIDPMLDGRIELAVRETLEAALPVLRDQLHATLTETLQDVISRAISKELAKIHSARAQKN